MFMGLKMTPKTEQFSALEIWHDLQQQTWGVFPFLVKTAKDHAGVKKLGLRREKTLFLKGAKKPFQY